MSNAATRDLRLDPRAPVVIPAGLKVQVCPPVSAEFRRDALQQRELTAGEVDALARGGELGRRGDAPAAPAVRAPTLALAPAELVGLPPAVLAELRPRRIDFIEPPTLVPPPPAPRPERWPGGFRPRPGSNAHRMLQVLAEVAPAGGVRWLSSRDLGAATGVDVPTVGAFIAPAVRAGAVAHRLVGPGRGSSEYQMGADDRAQPAAAALAVEHPAPAPAPAVPAAAPAAPIASLNEAPQTPAPPAPAAAGSSLGTDQLLDLATETAKEVLAHLDVEIARLEHNLRILSRRRELFAAAMRGARLAPPQGALRGRAASVGSPTEADA